MIDKRSKTPITTLGFVEGSNLDDSEFTAAELEAAERVLFEFVAARFPQHDLQVGSTLYDLLRPGAVNYLIVRRMQETFRATMSLQGVEDNPELADEATISAILSNYLISRSEGAKTRGTIRVTINKSRTVRIPEATVFTSADGLEFVTESEINASANSGTHPVLEDGAGNFYFDIQVVAADIGSLYDTASTSQFEIGRTVENLIVSNGLGDFAGGEDYESIDGLSGRILEALSVRNRISNAAIRSGLAADHPGVVGSVALGMGDPLMLRNRDNALGVATGGVVDIYVRTSHSPQTFEVEAVAQLVEGGDGYTYYADLPVEALPGHYRVLSVRPPGAGKAGTYQILSQERFVVPGGSSKRLPDVPSTAYSKFQDTEVIFRLEPLDGGSEEESSGDDALDVVLEVFAPEGISELQDYFDDPQSRVVGTDYLVRGFVPCMVTTSPIKVKVEELAEVTGSQVRAAIMSVIHLTPPGDGVRVDTIVAAVRSIPGVVEVDLPILLTGTIYTPRADAAIVEITSEGELVAPEVLVDGFGPDNTVYFTTPDRIGVTLQKV